MGRPKKAQKAQPQPDHYIKAIKHDLTIDGDLEILCLADFHIGDSNCDYRLMNELIGSVRDKPNRYAVLAGDIINNGLKNSKTNSYEEAIPPGEQLEHAERMFLPIKDKILCVVPGNHEERTTRDSDLCPMKIFADYLGIPSVYRRTSAFVVVRFGHNYHAKPICYSLYVNHGHGGGRRPGGAVNTMQDMSNIINTDAIILGHTHKAAVYTQKRYNVIIQRGIAEEQSVVLVNTGSALVYGGYGNRNGYQPSDNRYPVLTLHNDRRQIDATL